MSLTRAPARDPQRKGVIIIRVLMDLEQARTNMVEQQIRTWEVLDQDVLDLLFVVPREEFVPSRHQALAFADMQIPLGEAGQRMWEPKLEARVVQELMVSKADRVLEVGTGSGYVTALLARLGADVTSVERFNTLAESAAQHLKIVEAGKVRLEVGDGLAVRVRERFDRILLNGACQVIPETVTALLAPGSRLVGALTVDGMPHLVRIERDADGELTQNLGASLRISPLVTGIAATL